MGIVDGSGAGIAIFGVQRETSRKGSSGRNNAAACRIGPATGGAGVREERRQNLVAGCSRCLVLVDPDREGSWERVRGGKRSAGRIIGREEIVSPRPRRSGHAEVYEAVLNAR